MTRIINGTEYEVVFTGREALLSDYPRPSPLAQLCEEMGETLTNRHAGRCRPAYVLRDTHIKQAKADLARYAGR